MPRLGTVAVSLLLFSSAFALDPIQTTALTANQLEKPEWETGSSNAPSAAPESSPASASATKSRTTSLDPTTIAAMGKCAAAGGTCIQVQDCAKQSGTAQVGLCPGGEDMQCCTFKPTKKCLDLGGECISVGLCAAQARRSFGSICPGPDDLKCCSDSGNGTGTGGATGSARRNVTTISMTSASPSVSSSSRVPAPASTTASAAGAWEGVARWGSGAMAALAIAAVGLVAGV